MSTEERLQKHLSAIREGRLLPQGGSSTALPKGRAPTPAEHLRFALAAVAAAEPRPGLWIRNGECWVRLSNLAADVHVRASLAHEEDCQAAEQERYAADQEHLAAARVTRLVSRLGLPRP